MDDYYMTIGVQYGRDNPHPTLAPMHYEHYITITAPSEVIAYRIAEGISCGHYSMLRPASELSTEDLQRFFPRGEFAHITYQENFS